MTGWARRVFHKFGTLVDSAAYTKNHDDIVKVFDGMNQIVCEQLTQLNAKAADGDRVGEGVEYGDVFNDFATEDFISKNIRVRPVSGFTVKDETKDGRQSNISKAIV